MRKLVRKYKLLNDEFKASIWYTISNIFQKAAPWLIMIILTHMVSSTEYGMYSIYMSWVEIVEILVTLRIYSNGFVAGLVRNNERKDEYTATIEKISIILVTVWVIIAIALRKYICDWISLDERLIVFMILSFYGTISFGIWASRQRVENQYKKILLATFFYSILGPVIGALSVFLNLENKIIYVVAIRTIIQLVVSIPFCYSNIRGSLKAFDKYFAIDAIKYNLPLIPYYLSMVLLNSSDKIMIQKIYSYEEAALYSVAYSISMMIFIVSGALNLSIQPWLFKRLKNNENTKNTAFLKISTILVSVCCLFIVIIAPELIAIIGGEKYMTAIWVMPPLILSVLVMFIYQQFVNVLFYYKKTNIILFVSILAAILNIILNSIVIPIYGFIAAGYTTLFSYIIVMLLYYVFMKKICLKNKINMKNTFDIKFQSLVLSIMIFLFIIIVLLYKAMNARYAILIISLFILFIKKNYIIEVLRGLKNE